MLSPYTIEAEKSKYDETGKYKAFFLFFAYLGHGCAEAGAVNAINACTVEQSFVSYKIDLINFLIASVFSHERTVTFGLLDCCR